MRKTTKSSAIIRKVGQEVKKNPPKIVQHTAAKFGAARAAKQRTAIILDKARRAGAKISKKRS